MSDSNILDDKELLDSIDKSEKRLYERLEEIIKEHKKNPEKYFK